MSPFYDKPRTPLPRFYANVAIKGTLALALSHYGTVLNLPNAPSAQAPESPRVALSEPCSWRVEPAPSPIVLICHESEAALPKGSRKPGRWSPRAAAPALISQLEAKTTSLWNKHLYGRDRESLVNTSPSCFHHLSASNRATNAAELHLTLRL